MRPQSVTCAPTTGSLLSSVLYVPKVVMEIFTHKYKFESLAFEKEKFGEQTRQKNQELAQQAMHNAAMQAKAREIFRGCFVGTVMVVTVASSVLMTNYFCNNPLTSTACRISSVTTQILGCSLPAAVLSFGAYWAVRIL